MFLLDLVLTLFCTILFFNSTALIFNWIAILSLHHTFVQSFNF